MKISIIGLTGRMKSGKDTLASMMTGWKRIAFADALKDICVEHLGLTCDDVQTQQGKERYNPLWGMTNREVLQRVGTEAMRNGFDKDVWVKIARIKAERLLANGNNVVITDCRFDNEARMVRDLGGIVVEIRRKTQNVSSHSSEKGIDPDLVAFHVDNDGTIKQLFETFTEKYEDFRTRLDA